VGVSNLIEVGSLVFPS